MRYVIIRDDDTNAFTRPEHLERLYRPFLDHGLPVNLAVIPAVTTSAKMVDGRPEGFLLKNGTDYGSGTIPIAANEQLVRYIQENPGFKVVQHGCHHDYLEFDCREREEVARRLDEGGALLQEAGFPRPTTFVAPYDKFSRPSLQEVAARFRVISTGWYELRRLPYTWWPQYLVKKLRHSSHWQIGRTLLLSHPGCLLSCHRSYCTMLGGILHHVSTSRLTVLVTHWWEYFRNGEPDEPFIEFLHETASYLAGNPDLKVITFSELAGGSVPLN